MNRQKHTAITGLLVTISLLLASTEACPQSAGQNYIVTQIYTSTTAHNDVIQYYDGLGRPVETVRKQFTPGAHQQK